LAAQDAEEQGAEATAGLQHGSHLFGGKQMEEMHLELRHGREGRAQAREHVPIGGHRRGATQAGEQPLPTASLHHITNAHI
jgi:hypothetical protein